MNKLKQAINVKPNRNRKGDRQIYHALEHFDNAFTEMALGVNLLCKTYISQTKTQRRDDKKKK